MSEASRPGARACGPETAPLAGTASPARGQRSTPTAETCVPAVDARGATAGHSPATAYLLTSSGPVPMTHLPPTSRRTACPAAPRSTSDAGPPRSLRRTTPGTGAARGPGRHLGVHQRERVQLPPEIAGAPIGGASPTPLRPPQHAPRPQCSLTSNPRLRQLRHLRSRGAWRLRRRELCTTGRRSPRAPPETPAHATEGKPSRAPAHDGGTRGPTRGARRTRSRLPPLAQPELL
jgi:hypothetical protein